MAIIDSQVHSYEANTPKRPWHRVPNWPDHVTGDEMVAAMDTVGVDGAIFISAFSMYRYDASYAVEVQRAHPGRFALVKPVDPDDPAVADVIADWKKTPGAVGIRIMMTKEAGRDPNDPGVDRILHAAVRYDFPVNMLCRCLHAIPGTVSVPGHLGTSRSRVRRVGFRTLPLRYRLDSGLRSRQLRAGRRALPPDRPPKQQRTHNADGRCLRQGVWLVSEKGVTDLR
jgi:predicted TIM-barrel fold metal-dependent hydrolase